MVNWNKFCFQKKSKLCKMISELNIFCLSSTSIDRTTNNKLFLNQQYMDLQCQFQSSYFTLFQQLLLRNRNISSKCLFWNKQIQQAESRWQKQSYFTNFLIRLSTIHFQIGAIFLLLSVTKSSITKQKESIFYRLRKWLLVSQFTMTDLFLARTKQS